MTATADMILERRRERRKLAFWRIVAILAVVIVVLALIPMPAGTARGDHVARISIDGVILDDSDRAERIARIARNDRAKALIVEIASPGGTVVGSEVLFENIRDVAAAKPVVAVVGEVAASGGYIAALAADHIVSRRNSITGSIGVISQIPDVTGLMERIGVSVTEIKSSPLKAAPNPFEEPSEAAIDATERLILDSYDWFRGLVAERRGLEDAALESVSDGRVFTGAQAKENGLVDSIGGLEQARSWLETEHEVPAALPVVDYRWTEGPLPFPFDRFEEALARFLPAAPVSIAPGPRLLALYTG